MKKVLFLLVSLLFTGILSAQTIQNQLRSSANPIAGINPLPPICSGDDTVYATVGYDPGSTILLQHISVASLATGSSDSITFIPDGPNCPPGTYTTGITMTQFSPGQTMTNTNDLLSVCVKIEHSFAGDLGFVLYCPNGQSVVIDGNDHSGGSYLGDANDIDGTPACDPAANTPGIGWVYGWSQFYPQQGSLNVLDALTSPVPATDTINNTGYLTPDNSFTGFFGCPLNGTWNLQVTDNWGIDNGYIFRWQLHFDPSLLPGGQPTALPIDTVIWSGSFINIVDDSTIMIVPDSAGTYLYSVTVIDTSGNSFDTTFSYTVIETPELNLGPDTTLCAENLNYILDAGIADNYDWSTGNVNRFQFVNATGIYSVKTSNFDSTLSLECYAFDTVQITVVSCAGINELTTEGIIFSLDPNPAKNIINLRFELSEIVAEIRIYNQLGQIERTFKTADAVNSIDISDLPVGIYILEVKTDNVIGRQKFIKE
jgi:subtilisin-like proprotein convertase family protein